MTLTKAVRDLAVLAAAALFVASIALQPALAVGTDDPPAPAPAPAGQKAGDKKDEKKDQTKGVKEEKKEEKKGSAVEQREKLAQQKADEKFLRNYRAARELILAGRYEAGIAAMHALGHDEHPDVANYIGYANRKLGHYDQSKIWYEAALKSDPNHVRTWSYYGMWHAEQGNRLKAQDYLAKVNALCGNSDCEEFVELKAVIDGKASY